MGVAINVRRGMFRLWVVIAVIWCAGVAVLTFEGVAEKFRLAHSGLDVPESLTLLLPVRCNSARGTEADYTRINLNDPGPWQKYELCWYKMEKFRELWPEYDDLSDDELTDRLYDAAMVPRTLPRPWAELTDVLLLAALPPLALLAFGYVLIWVGAGFVASSSKT